MGIEMDLEKDIAGVVSKNVKAARLKAGLSQRALAKKAGLSIRYISRLETDPQNIRIDKVAVLARHMGLEPASLLMDGPNSLAGNAQEVLTEAIRLLETLRSPS